MTHSITLQDTSECGSVEFRLDGFQYDSYFLQVSTKGTHAINEGFIDLNYSQVQQLIAFLKEVSSEKVEDISRRFSPAPLRVPSYGNMSAQAQKVWQHMNRAGSISAREAMDDHGITSAVLARRICDIEEEGFAVTRERRVHPITGKRYTRYALADQLKKFIS